MKVAIIGAGALGCYYGAKLARSGEDVHFIARGETLQALKTRGLTVMRDDETFAVSSFTATDDAAGIGPVDLVLVVTKSYDLNAIAPALRFLKGPDTIVLPLQNGVDSAERLGTLTDSAHILGGLTYLPATIVEPGVVRQSGLEKPILLGALNREDEASAEIALTVLRKAGIAAEHPIDIRAALWMKYMLVIGTMGVQSVTGGTMGATRSDSDTRALYLACMQEVYEVATRFGVQLPVDAVEQSMRAIDSYPANVKASMLQDLERGKPLELDAMHGTVVRIGKEFGVETPTNQFIYTALKLRMHGAPSQ